MSPVRSFAVLAVLIAGACGQEHDGPRQVEATRALDCDHRMVDEVVRRAVNEGAGHSREGDDGVLSVALMSAALDAALLNEHWRETNVDARVVWIHGVDAPDQSPHMLGKPYIDVMVAGPRGGSISRMWGEWSTADFGVWSDAIEMCCWVDRPDVCP